MKGRGFFYFIFFSVALLYGMIRMRIRRLVGISRKMGYIYVAQLCQFMGNGC